MNTNYPSPTQKTTQVMLAAQTDPWPESQKIERMAIYNPDGTPFNGDQVGKIVAPVKAPALAAVSNAVAVDASKGNIFDLTFTSSGWTISNPTNPVDGQEITFRLTQGGSGSYTVTWASAYDFGSAPGAVTLSTSVGKVDHIKFMFNAALGKWCALLAAKGD